MGAVSKGPVLQLIKGEILQVAGCLSQEYHGQRQGIHRRSGETIIISGWSFVQYVDFFLFCISNIIINAVRRKKEKEEEKKTVVLGFRCGDISPV